MSHMGVNPISEIFTLRACGRLRAGSMSESPAVYSTLSLTPKQEAFAQAYVECGNASEAYRRSYDVKPGTRPGTVYVEACKLASDPKISRRLHQLTEAAAERAIVSKAHVLRELAAVAFGTLDDVAPWDEEGPRLMPSRDLPREQRALIGGMKVKRTREFKGYGEDKEPWEVEHVEIKQWDKLKALDLLGRHLKMWDTGDTTNVTILAQFNEAVRALPDAVLALIDQVDEGGGE